jgi:hypothetical protein
MSTTSQFCCTFSLIKMLLRRETAHSHCTDKEIMALVAYGGGSGHGCGDDDDDIPPDATLYSTRFRSIWVLLCLASIGLLLCPDLCVFVHLTWLVAWLFSLPCRIWCKVIIIIIIRQDDHATNHARCKQTRRAGQSRKHIEAKQSATIYLANMWSTTPAKQSVENAPCQ